MAFDDALNSVAVLGYHAAECHCMSVMAQYMMDALNNSGYIKDEAVRAALMRVFELSMLQNIRETSGDFGSVLSPAQQRLVHRRINELLLEIRPV